MKKNIITALGLLFVITGCKDPQDHTRIETQLIVALAQGSTVASELNVFTTSLIDNEKNHCTGTVTFKNNGKNIPQCLKLPIDPSGAATCEVRFPITGSFEISAEYSGDAKCFAAVSSKSFTAKVTEL